MKKIVFVLSFLLTSPLFAETWMPSIFNDNMMLQRGVPAPIWGKDAPGTAIEISFAGRKAKCVADEAGNWKAELKAMKAGVTGDLIVKGSSERTITNVVVGDIWVASGQSNMQFGLGSATNAAKEIAAADFPLIRFFQVDRVVSAGPTNDLAATWKICGTNNAGSLSAVGYFFAREIHTAEKIPVGIIESSWGGTPAEAWTSIETLKSDPDFAFYVTRYESNTAESADSTIAAKLKAWKDKYGDVDRVGDTNNEGFAKGWASPTNDVSDWKEMDLPSYWESKGLQMDGTVWFRKDIVLPESAAGQELKLSLSAIDDFDTTYFNGTQVGSIGGETTNWWQTPRNYKVPGALVKAGTNCIAVRVFDNAYSGGIMGPKEEMSVSLNTDGAAHLAELAGAWKYKVEYTIDPKPAIQLSSWTPSALWNAMIEPLLPFPITGAIWYQGESNAGKAYEYRKLFPAMINCWRKAWGIEFPFIFVQLANFKETKPEPADDTWAELREAQTMTLSLPKTGMAVAIDIGEAKDIHPKNKQDVGKRLALYALATVYGEKKLVYSGPMYDSMKIKNGTIILKFKHIGKGLEAKGDKLEGFAIAGEDQKFVWADAKIVDKTVVVSSDKVANPVAVRYAWAINPTCNLYNKEGLPASPFRTDTWPGLTEKKE